MPTIERTLVILIGLFFISIGVIGSSVPATVYGILAIFILMVFGGNDDDFMRA
jgi:putative effector of murein hydrolase LrgA (UPF0299 family)